MSINFELPTDVSWYCFGQAIDESDYSELIDFEEQGIKNILEKIKNFETLDENTLKNLSDELKIWSFRSAAYVGNLFAAEQIFKLFPDIINDRGNDDTALHLAALKGHLSVVKFLVENGATVDIYDQPDCGNTPLLLASCRGHTEIVKYLLDNGANIEDDFSSDSQTPLIIAAERDHFDTVSLLLEYGADKNKCDDEDYNAFEYALKNNNLEMARLLKPELDISQIFVKSAKYGRFKFAKRLLEEFNIDINFRNKRGMTAVMYITNPEQIKYFLEKGADITLKDNDGYTLLMHYCNSYSAKHEMVRHLITCGSQID